MRLLTATRIMALEDLSEQYSIEPIAVGRMTI
jgi:hypothetical protein